ncbi:MAG: metalloregulator ArsR/SmtB family transcription factor [Desulfobacula sp.]|uniref:ArsR/SmtB family transcription factor n=1 Tax=Desulfobacula sp. TaxID=2593537 RepID=UPI0025C04C95|nr:metalloregulator ArsR/SmtB family transcription factor [Desulfobacula sp.]MCD4718954.1 metalloregulator ArsR/SmtB family transcription factor [Desulfobacula sp.]
MDICTVKCINEKKVKETLKTIPQLEDIGQMANIFKALSDPSRLKIVLTLLNQEHCVCDIAVICNQTDSAISHQLRILRTLKIVKNRRQGKIIYYSIDDDHVVSLINMSLDHVRH